MNKRHNVLHIKQISRQYDYINSLNYLITLNKKNLTTKPMSTIHSLTIFISCFRFPFLRL